MILMLIISLSGDIQKAYTVPANVDCKAVAVATTLNFKELNKPLLAKCGKRVGDKIDYI